MRFSLGLLLVTACGSSSTPVQMPVKATNSTKHVIVALGRTSGSYVETYKPDGTLEATLHILQNGRGPHVDATIRFAADGTIDQLTASGHHEMGNKNSESFERKGGYAWWKGTEEEGKHPEADGKFFVPMSSLPIEHRIAQVALDKGGSVDLLPYGKSTVTKVGELEVKSSKNESKKVIAYAVTGFDFMPSYTWLDENGGWFGNFSHWRSTVPEGWETAIEPILKAQDQFEKDLDQKIYTANAQKPPAAGLALTNARVFDPDKGTFIDGQTVVVVGDSITAVGPTKTTKVPDGAKVIDLGGESLLPGMIDMHSHTAHVDGVLDIASGVTTVRDVGNAPDMLDELKESMDTGKSVGPRIVRMGFIEGRNEKAAASKVTAETPDEARAAVEFFAKRGYEGIKIYNSIKTELVPILTQEAHKRGMLVTGHVPVHMVANEAVKAGYDGIEHINQLLLNFFATKDTDTRTPLRFTLVGDKAPSLDLSSKQVQDFFTELREKKVVVDPTLIAFQDLYLGEPGKIVPGWEPYVVRMPGQLRREFLVNGLPMEGDKRQLYRDAWAKLLATVKALYDAKVPLVIGTDHIGGLAYDREVELFVEAGIPTAQVLQMATIGAARAMKQDRHIGSIAVGKKADMFVVPGDPLANVQELRRVRMTVSRGVVFESDPLFQAVGVLPEPGPIMGRGPK